jgi:hypothetical protein
MSQKMEIASLCRVEYLLGRHSGTSSLFIPLLSGALSPGKTLFSRHCVVCCLLPCVSTASSPCLQVCSAMLQYSILAGRVWIEYARTWVGRPVCLGNGNDCTGCSHWTEERLYSLGRSFHILSSLKGRGPLLGQESVLFIGESKSEHLSYFSWVYKIADLST